jgi:hypothetical protein
MWVIEDVPELIYCLAISPRLIANHALNRSQCKREKCVAAAVQRRSYRLGTDKFAESHHRRAVSKVVCRGQVLQQQILRHLDGIDDYAVRTHERYTGFWRSSYVRIAEPIICSPISHRQMAPAKYHFAHGQGLAARHTILDVIGCLLTNRCQVEKLLFYG